MNSDFEFYSDDEDLVVPDSIQLLTLPPIPKDSGGIPTDLKPRLRDSILLKKKSILEDHRIDGEPIANDEMMERLNELEKSILEVASSIGQRETPKETAVSNQVADGKDLIDLELKEPDLISKNDAQSTDNESKNSLNIGSNAAKLISAFVQNLEIEGITIASPVADDPQYIPVPSKASDKKSIKKGVSRRGKSKRIEDPPPVPKLEDIKNYDELIKSSKAKPILKSKRRDVNPQAVDLPPPLPEKDADEPVIKTVALDQKVQTEEVKEPVENFRKEGTKNDGPKVAYARKRRLLCTGSASSSKGSDDEKTPLESESNDLEVTNKIDSDVNVKQKGSEAVIQSSGKRKEIGMKKSKTTIRKISTRNTRKDRIAGEKEEKVATEAHLENLDVKNDSDAEVSPKPNDPLAERTNNNEGQVAKKERDATTPDSARQNFRKEMLGILNNKNEMESETISNPVDCEEGVVDLLDDYYPAKKHLFSMAIHDIFDVYDPDLALTISVKPNKGNSDTTINADSQEITTAYTDNLLLLYETPVERTDLDSSFKTKLRKKLPPRGKSFKTIKISRIGTDAENLNGLSSEQMVPKSAVTMKRKPSIGRPDLDRLNLLSKRKL